jgi:hypothetical protein
MVHTELGLKVAEEKGGSRGDELGDVCHEGVLSPQRGKLISLVRICKRGSPFDLQRPSPLPLLQPLSLFSLACSTVTFLSFSPPQAPLSSFHSF